MRPGAVLAVGAGAAGAGAAEDVDAAAGDVAGDVVGDLDAAGAESCQR